MGDGTVIWHLAQVLERAALGHDCDVVRGAYIGADRWRRPQTGEEYAERDGTLHPVVPA
jgi:UDP-3-O-[3-hydroxymyristoyl] glucosamine N-acyltransferase